MRKGSRAWLLAILALLLGFILSWHLSEAAPFVTTITAVIAKFAHDGYRDVNGAKVPADG